jgi:hypothetical protein
MKKLNLTLYLAIRDIPVETLYLLFEYLSDASGAVILMNLEAQDSFDLITKLPQKKRDRIVQCLIDLEGAEERLLTQVLAKVVQTSTIQLTSSRDSLRWFVNSTALRGLLCWI